MGTLKRDSNLRMFDRSLVYSKITDFNQIVDDQITNLDHKFLEMSTQRFKMISEAYKSLYACRTILIPRNGYQSLMFDGETARYAITAGNDRKIRYWNLENPEQLSYQLNSPNDDEVQYITEKNVTRDTKVILEKPGETTMFPKMSAMRLKDVKSCEP